MGRYITDQEAGDHRLVSLKTLAGMVDAHRSTVRRWLDEEGIRPKVVGRGASGAVRYRWADVKDWLEGLESLR